MWTHTLASCSVAAADQATPPPPGLAGVVVGQVGRTFRGLKGSHVGAEAGQWLVIHSHSLDGWARVSHPDGRQGLFPYSCIDESSLRPAPHLLSLKLMGKDGGPPLPPPRAAPPTVLPAEPLMSATPASTGHADTTTTTAPQAKDKGKEQYDDTSDSDGDNDDDTSSDDLLESNSDGEEDGDDDDGNGDGCAPPAAPARGASRENSVAAAAAGGERRGTRYLRTDELEQLYSALFRRSLHHPRSSAAAEPSSTPPPRTPPAPPVARSSSSPSPKPVAAAAQAATAATEAPVPAAADRAPLRTELEKKRLRLVEELIESEELYLRHLHIIQQVYLPPLVEKGVLVGEQERFLSSNVGLFADMHREFHSLLFRRFRRYSYATPQPQPPPIGDIFLTMARHHIKAKASLFFFVKSYFGNYHRFCSGHAAALAALHKLNETSSAFRRCIRNIEASEAARGLTLAELLIAPVERICKYPRFLSELLELTPRTAVDYELLCAAQEQIVAVVKASNEAAARGANHQRMRQIAGYFSRQHLRDIMGTSRNFIHEGRLYAFDPPGSGGGGIDQQSAPTGKPVVVFLFSDIMVVADRLKSAKLLDPAKRHKRCFSSMHRIPLASSRIINVVAADTNTGIADATIAQQQQRVSVSTVSEASMSPLSTDAPSPRGSTAGDDDDLSSVDSRQQQQATTNSDSRKAKGSLRRWRKQDSDSTPDVQSQQTHHLHRFELQALWRSADEEHVLRRYLFGAESEDEKRMWFRSIQKLINHALLRQMNALPAGEAGDDYHHDTTNTNSAHGDDNNDDNVGGDDEEESSGSSRRKPTTRRAASFSSASHSNSGLLAKAKASTTFRRKVERLRSSDQSSSSGSGKSPPASPKKKAAKKETSPRKHHAPPPLDATTDPHHQQQQQPRQPTNNDQPAEGMEGGAARDEVSLLRDEIEQLKLQLHTLRPFTGSLPWDSSSTAAATSISTSATAGESPMAPSAAGSPSSPSTPSLIVKRRQRRSQSATT